LLISPTDESIPDARNSQFPIHYSPFTITYSLFTIPPLTG
jgi:hypothetical protein